MTNTQALASLKEGEDVLLSEEETVYLVDGSGSMCETIGYDGDVSVTKCEAVRKAMTAMMDARLSYATADKAGIVVFGVNGRSMTEVVAPLEVVSHNHVASISRIGAGGGTPMFQGLEKAAAMLSNANGLARIVLMSDGEPNEGYNKPDIIGLVRKLSKQYGFIIDTVGIGVPEKTHSYDEQFMKDMANEGAGQFFPIDNVEELVKLLKKTAIERKALFGDGIKLLGDGNKIFKKS